MVFGSYLKEEQKEQMDFAHQEEMIKQLQALLEEADETLKESFKKFHQGNFNPTEALTFLLEASDWDVQRAHKKLLDCLQWRVQSNFDNVLAKHLIPIYRAIGDSQIMGLYSKEPCPDEYFAVKEGVKCYPCIRVEALEEGLKVIKNKFGISDFPGFAEAWKAGDKKTVPLYLGYVHNAFGCNVTATTTHSNDMIALPLGLFYASIDEMHKMKLEDIINEDVILKWGCVMRDAKKMGLDVEFAEEHLKKIAHAYFVAAESNKEELCSMSERESFDDGAPLSKGLLPFASSEQSA